MQSAEHLLCVFLGCIEDLESKGTRLTMHCLQQ